MSEYKSLEDSYLGIEPFYISQEKVSKCYPNNSK